MRRWSLSSAAMASHSSTSNSVTPSPCSACSARSTAPVTRACLSSSSRQPATRFRSVAVTAIPRGIIEVRSNIAKGEICSWQFLHVHVVSARMASSSSTGTAQTGAGPATDAAQQTTDPGQHWDARLWGALVVLCGVLFLDGLDVSMVGVALPSIGSDLDLSTSALQWVVSGYVLGYGGLLLLGGRFADLLGRRRVLLAALAVFTAASLVGGLVDNGTLLVITRFLKGAAAAFTAPASLSYITTTFAEGPARNRALAISTACGASGFSLGLVLGGAMTELGWRWTFFLPVPIAIAILIAAPRLLAKDAPAAAPARRSFDFAGALTITAAMLLLVRTVVEAPNAGWGAPATLGGLVAAALLLAAFLAIELRA